jgi:hypothetical protein
MHVCVLHTQINTHTHTGSDGGVLVVAAAGSNAFGVYLLKKKTKTN